MAQKVKCLYFIAVTDIGIKKNREDKYKKKVIYNHALHTILDAWVSVVF